VTKLIVEAAWLCVLAVSAGMAATGPAVLEQNDVQYAIADGKPLLLDLHIPAGKGPFPTAIIVHGGGFNMGNKRMFVTPLFPLLNDAGFAWFSIDYRLAPAYRFPSPVQDLDAAILWVKANAHKYRVDPKRIALIGESAGAYLVAYAGTHSQPATKVAAVVDIYGPNDLALSAELKSKYPERFDQTKAASHRERTGDFFSVDSLDDAGKAARMREVSPISGVHAGMPPFLCIHGTADEQVPYEQSPAMCAAIRKVGGVCDLITVEGGRHGMGNWESHPEMLHWKPEMIAWLRKTLR
jgi:acetyl esterase